MRKLCLALLIAGLSVGASAFDLGSVINGGKALAKVAQSQQDIDEPHEVLIGADMTSKVLGVAPLVEDQELQRYVNHVGMWLASQSERPDLKWHFCVISSPSINAMSERIRVGGGART
jgi:predicted Zn-dependent protease